MFISRLTHKNVALGLLGLLWFSLPAMAQEPDRSAPPELGPPPVLTLPKMEKFTLSNGIPVIYMQKSQVPLIQVNVILRSGRVDDPKGKTGLATLVADMLDEGAGERDALALADAIDFLGANISTSAGQHATTVSLNCPVSQIEKSLELLSDIILRPQFPETELQRLQIERLNQLLQWHDEPNTIATVGFYHSLYGEQHPYGKTRIGSEKEIRGITVNDIRDFYQRHFISNNAFIVVVGDSDAEDIQTALNHYFQNWQTGDKPQTDLPQPKNQEPKIILIDKPGAPQSVIRIGKIGVSRYTDDYYALVVMNTLLGGSFTSRLNSNLREEHGYTYGAGSIFFYYTEPGPFLAYSSVGTDVTAAALTEFKKEITGITEISRKDLDRAKNYVALRYPRNFQTASQIATELEEWGLYDLPEDYFNTYIQDILSVSKNEVVTSARETIAWKDMTIIVVGDVNTIKPEIQALNWGEIEVYNISDILGPLPEL
jgi:predicted Zn-dependent peptidase